MTEALGIEQVSLFTSRAKHAIALVAMVILSACSVVPKGPPKTVEAPPVIETPTTPSLPTDTARHRVALLVPMTGTNAGVGEAIANAANMAVLDTGGKTIRITTYDTATGATAAAQKAIAEGNRLILGPLLAEDVRAVAAVGRAARVPLISFSNDVSVAGNGTYVMGFVPTQAIDRVVSYARGAGMARFAALVPNNLYGQRSSSAMVRSVQAAGGTLVGSESFEPTAASIAGAVTKLSAAAPYDAILIAGSGKIAIQTVPLIRRSRGGQAKILGTELWNTESALTKSPVIHGAWFASVSDKLYGQLAVKYRTRFGKAPYRLSSLGYDSVLLVTKVAAGWRVGTPFPAGVLSDPGGFSGIDGAFRFGRDNVAERTLEVQQVDASGLTLISPAARSFAK
ncbi:MAG: penicillin-binding protein activator [Sphingomonadaceae bacterium]